MTSPTIEWNSTVPVERAMRILGLRSLDGITEGHAWGRCTGYWDANEREYHVAWKSIALHLDAKEANP